MKFSKEMSTKIKSLLLTLLLTLSLASWAWGATETFYACAGGNGTAPETGACATAYDIANLNNGANYDIDDADDGKIGPNDDVVFLDDGGNFGTTPILLGAAHPNGLIGKPITFRAGTGESPVIDGGGATTAYLLQAKKAYYTFDGLEMQDVDGYVFDCDGCTYNLLNDCDFHADEEVDVANSGVYIHGTSDEITISNCTAYDNYNGIHLATTGEVYLSDAIAYSNGNDGFAGTAGNVSASTFTDCVAYSNGDDGYDFLRSESKIMLRCLAYSNTNLGIKLQGSGDPGLSVTSCIAYGNGNGLQDSTTDGTTTLKNCVLSNNTKRGIMANLAVGTLAVSNCIIANNNGTTGIIIPAAGLTYAGTTNCIYNTGANNTSIVGGADYTVAQFADWQTATSSDAASLAVDPRFWDATAGDFRVKNRDVATGGTNVSLTTDINGKKVPFGGGYPIGAYRAVGKPWMYIDGIIQ